MNGRFPFPSGQDVPNESNDPLSSEDRMKLNELMNLCTNLQSKVLELEQTKVDFFSVDEELFGCPRGCFQTGGKITYIDDDANVTLVAEGEGRNEEMMFDAEKDLAGEEVVVEKVVEEENLNEDKITVAQTLQMLKSIPKAKGVTISEPSDTQRPIILKQKNLDKGKAKMIEPEKPLKRKDQILLDEQEARRLQTIFDEEARMLMDKRKKHFAAKRAKEKRSKPPTKAQKRKTMSTYLKNMAGWKLHQLKGKSYDEVEKLFDQAMVRVNNFVAIDSKVLEGPSKRAGDELEKEAKKKQKIDDDEEIAKLQALIKKINLSVYVCV
ncbi:hypothetical protein Tco_0115902 [Tanacetum coccineum]